MTEPRRMITIEAFEDMSLFTEDGMHNAVLKEGVPTQVLADAYERTVLRTPGVKIIKPGVTVEPEVVAEPEEERPPNDTEKKEILVKAAKHVLLNGDVKRDYTPTGRIRVATLRELVNFDFKTAWVKVAQEKAQLQIDIANDDSG